MKRVGLARTTPLESGSSLTRYAGLPRGGGRITASRAGIFPAAETGASPRTKNAATRSGGSGKFVPPAPSEFTPKVKKLVRRRAGQGDEFEARAECCGKWLGEKAGEFQHRAARGAGGCRDAVINGPANCLLMCPEHHRAAEDRDSYLGMEGAGFWLRHGTTPEFDPRNVAITLHRAGGGRRRFILAADGLGPDGSGYLTAPPKEAAA